MRIVKPSVELIHSTPNSERVIERMGRICYQSSHKVKECENCNGEGRDVYGPSPRAKCDMCGGAGTDISSAIAFVKMILANGHESVLEHASAGFSIITDRGVTHEIVRHRIASYSQESTRYCSYDKANFGGELTFIQPPNLVVMGKDAIAAGPANWATAMQNAELVYMALLKEGVSAQIARSVLPNALKSEIGMTANFREWRHFFTLRTSPKAHPQMREIAEMIRERLLSLSPVCFGDIP
jgi:thymidylate synthase (FAD)